MNVVDALIKYLLTRSELAYLAGRIYPRSPQGAIYPQLVVKQISGVPVMALDGPDGLVQGRIQLDCTDRTYAGAKTLADLLTLSTKTTPTPGFLNGYRGSPSGLRISCWVDNETDTEEPPRDANDVAKYHTHIDLVIWYGR